MNAFIGLFLVCAGLVGLGYWWGTANAERLHREQRAALESERILVSIPVDKKQGAEVFEMLTNLMREVEQ